MRRSEFSSSSDEDLKWIANNALNGHLGLIDEKGYPRIIPLNFILIDKNIYFHGAQEGEKFDLLKESPNLSFNIDIPYSYIPSYWINDRMACPATTFFKSVHIRGNGVVVSDPHEKVMVLVELMKKYQPEAKFEPINYTDKLYKKEIDKTGIFKIIAKEITIKNKFGQNLNETTRKKLIERLKERNLGKDKDTIKEIEKTLTEFSSHT